MPDFQHIFQLYAVARKMPVTHRAIPNSVKLRRGKIKPLLSFSEWCDILCNNVTIISKLGGRELFNFTIPSVGSDRICHPIEWILLGSLNRLPSYWFNVLLAKLLTICQCQKQVFDFEGIDIFLTTRIAFSFITYCIVFVKLFFYPATCQLD